MPFVFPAVLRRSLDSRDPRAEEPFLSTRSSSVKGMGERKPTGGACRGKAA